MRTPKAFLTATLIAVLLLLPAPLAAAGADPTSTQGSVEVGVWDASTDGSPDVVSEYEPDQGGADLAVEVETFQDWGHLFLTAHGRAANDQAFELGLDVGRSVRTHTTYTALLHRLGRDPLTNLEAATQHGRVVWHTDLSPEGRYEIDYGQLTHRTELQFPGAPALTLGLGYRLQEREGFKQALTVSHCDSCHVVSQSRPIDESTEDASLDATWAFGGGQVKASFLHRELRDSAPALTLVFDDALQPELRTPLFDNRLSFDSAQGPQEVHRRPELTKDVIKLEVALADVAGFAVDLGGVWTSTENEGTGLTSDYNGYLVSATRKLKESWQLRWRARAYSIDNDDVFVDIAEPAGIAGPHLGRTYRQAYGFDPDYLRRSSLDRQVFESKTDLSYRMGKKAGTFKLTWDLESIDRDNYEVAPGETRTTENVLGLSWWGRPRKGMRLRASLRHGEVDHPFALVDGGFSTLVSPMVTSPFAPQAAQYFQFQDARVAETTAAPETWDELKASLSQIFDGKTLSVSYRYWDGDNDDGDFTDWSRTQQSATASLWGMPAPRWQWNLAYTWQDTELGFPIFIPIFDG
ncbi:MAG: hypothetical protein KDD47_03755 [Acidobacteria bacterium]|nr:hypothetical protein [Acidobacteriota bacterium]